MTPSLRVNVCAIASRIITTLAPPINLPCACSVVLEMATKRSACDSASSSKASKKTILYCHFNSSWKAQESSVPVGDRSGAQRTEAQVI